MNAVPGDSVPTCPQQRECSCVVKDSFIGVGLSTPIRNMVISLVSFAVVAVDSRKITMLNSLAQSIGMY